MDPHKHIPFIDVQGHRKYIGNAIDEAVSRVLAHGRYVMGPEVEEFENALKESNGDIEYAIFDYCAALQIDLTSTMTQNLRDFFLAILRAYPHY